MSIPSVALPFVEPYVKGAPRVLSLGTPEGIPDNWRESWQHLTVLDLPNHNLNYPGGIHTLQHGLYDLVIDPGTIEHIANVSELLRYVMQSIDKNGYLLQVVPLTMYGHGYWAYTPELLHDTLRINGFVIHTFRAYTLHENRSVPVLWDRNTSPPREVWLLSLAQRVDAQPWRWPTQERYL